MFTHSEEYMYVSLKDDVTQLDQKKNCVFKTPGHAEDLLSVGVMNLSRTANLAGSFAHAHYV